jgi:hypothetical protein
MAGYDEQPAVIRERIANHYRPIIFRRCLLTGRLILFEVQPP